jgi:DNA-binding XRE family transcriptional regulator
MLPRLSGRLVTDQDFSKPPEFSDQKTEGQSFERPIQVPLLSPIQVPLLSPIQVPLLSPAGDRDLGSDSTENPLWKQVVDTLRSCFQSRQQLPSSPTKVQQFICDLELPLHPVRTEDSFAARILRAFDGQAKADSQLGTPQILNVLRVDELQHLLLADYLPFRLNGRYEVGANVTADGREYWASITVHLAHVGETVLNSEPFSLTRPTIKVSVTPNPDLYSADGTRIVLDTLLESLYRKMERQMQRLGTKVGDAFPRGEGRMPNNAVVVAGLLAINKGGKNARSIEDGWKEGEGGRLTCRFDVGRGGSVIAYPDLPKKTKDEFELTEGLWRFVENLDCLTSDVALAVLAQLCEPSTGDRPKHPMFAPVIITDDAILRYLGVKRRGRARRAQREKIYDAMERLQRLFFDIHSVSAVDPATLKFKGVFYHGDRLFDIVKIAQYQEDLFGARKTVSITWSVRPGHWACWWFSTETRLYISKMARVLLTLGSHKSRVFAKKLGQRVLLLSQICKPKGHLRSSVRSLLRDIGELLPGEARCGHWGSKTRDAFEKAIEKLMDVGILKACEWRDGYGPGHRDRSRGWVERWLDARLEIITVASAPDSECQATRRRPKTQSRGRSRKAVISGQEVRDARTDIIPRVNQQELGNLMGVTRSCISQIESGRRTPRPKLAAALRAWIVTRRKQDID